MIDGLRIDPGLSKAEFIGSKRISRIRIDVPLGKYETTLCDTECNSSVAHSSREILARHRNLSSVLFNIGIDFKVFRGKRSIVACVLKSTVFEVQ